MKSKEEEEVKKVREQAAINQELKAKYKIVAKCEDTDASGILHVVYFREPSRLAVGAAMATLDTNTLQACEYIFNDCAIREVGDPEHWLNNNGLFIGISGILQSLIQVKKSVFTRL